MLYETSARKPGNVTSKPAAKPAHQAVKTSSGAGPKKPQSMARTSTPKHPASTTHAKQAVKGWPSHQKNATKSHTPAVAGHHSRQQQMAPKGHPAVKPGHATVKGWPHHQTSSRPGHPHSAQTHRTQPGVKYAHTTATVHPRHGHAHAGYAIKPGHKTVTGWAHHRKNIYQPGVAPTGRIYRHPHHAKPEYKYPQGWSYYPGTRRPYYYNGTPAPTYVNVTEGQPPVQTTGWGTTGVPQATVPAGCPTPQSSSVSSNRPQHVCHTCGGTKGCITLSRFAFNSAQIKPRHTSQLRELAERILNQNIKAVVATGHTDSSGSEDYNQALGEKRAHSVISELKKQLSILRPNGHKHLFWNTDSKGETQPISKTNPANNRRVEICLRRGML